MYKYYDKNDYKIMKYEFDSITEFIDYLDKSPISKAFECKTLSSEEFDDSDWYKTSCLKEAKELATYGYRENFDNFLKLKMDLEKYITVSPKKFKQYNDYIGYAPDVKAYLEGNPLSMFNRINPPRKQIDIYYNSANLSNVDANQIFNRGVITLCIVEILEKLGFSVNLNIFTMSSCAYQVHYAVFSLKNTTERLNVQKLFFPMCHPSWFRRLVFKLYEVTPDIYKNWCSSYGKTANEQLIREIIGLKPNDIVICRPDEMNVKGKDIVDDANAMFNYINKYSDKDFELHRLRRVR